MKSLCRSIAILGLLILLLPHAWAQCVEEAPCPELARLSPAMMWSVPVSGLSCSETTQQAPTDMDDAQDSSLSFGKGAATDWAASQFVYAGTTGELCKVYFYLSKTGSLAGKSIYAYIYTNDGASPPHPAAQHVACGSMDADTIEAGAWYGFSCSGVNLTNSDTYWGVLELRTAGDTSNYVTFYADSSCATERLDYGDPGVAWNNSTTALCGNMKLYILE